MAQGGQCNRFAMVVKKDSAGNVVSRDPSKLHIGLLEKIASREVANYIYAKALLPGVFQTMKANGYTENSLGLFSAKDVLDFFFPNTNINYLILDSSMKSLEKSLGIRDSNNTLKEYDDSMEALLVADNINLNYEAYAATVVQHGDKYNVLVHPRSSKSHYRVVETQNRLFVWDKLTEVMKMNGVDLDRLRLSNPAILNVTNSGLVNYLISIANSDNLYLSVDELKFLLDAGKNLPEVQRLMQHFSQLAQANNTNVYQDIFNVIRTGSPTTWVGLVDNALKLSKQLFNVLDNNFTQQLQGIIDNDNALDIETGIRKELKDLNKKYGIDFTEYKIGTGKHIESLSDATARAIITLLRRIRILENRKGTLDERKNLAKLHDSLVRELESKQYYSGLLSYITEAKSQFGAIKDKLELLPNNGTPFENACRTAEVLQEINVLADCYMTLMDDLWHLDNTTVDENLSQSDIDNLKKLALETYNFITELKSNTRTTRDQCMMNIIEHILGKQFNDDITIANVAKMCTMESWGTDILYSFGKLSDPICAAIGDMVRDAQDDRDDRLRDISLRIRRLTNKLYKSGSNSLFMFENPTTILSDYDWEAYRTAYKKEKIQLRKQNPGITEIQLEEAMEQWEDANTEDLVVDQKSGRTEKVPNAMYRKSYKGQTDRYGNPVTSFRQLLTKELLEYYDEMMLIKGEIGTLLPEYAQKLFFPPQLRRDWINALSNDGLSAKSWEAIKESVKSEFILSQDDTDYALASYLGREGFKYSRGDLSGKELREIPIFFVSPLSKPDLILKNFSAGIQALAATAHNYNAMSEILDVAEFMRDWVNDKERGSAATTGGAYKVEGYSHKSLQITQNIVKNALNTIMAFILDNMFDKHFYGLNLKGNPILNKAILKGVAYTSLRGLATNTFGAAANLIVGLGLLFLMALANTYYKLFTKQKTPYFSLTDWLYGFTRLFGELPRALASVTTGKLISSPIVDMATRNRSSKDYILAEYFNLFNDNYGVMMHEDLRKGFRQYLHNITFILYGAGEYAIRYNAMWAMLKSRKVLVNGKTKSLLNALHLSKDDKDNPNIVWEGNLEADGVMLTDSAGNLTEEGEAYRRKFLKDLRYACQGMFGAMNEEDKGIIHMAAIGRAGMNFRQWSVAHFSERFRGVHWDMDKKEFVRGYWSEGGLYLKKSLTDEEAEELKREGRKIKFIGTLIKNVFRLRTKFASEWAASNDTLKLNLMRLASAVSTYILTFLATSLMLGRIAPGFFGLVGDKDKEKEEMKRMTPAQKFAYYLAKRLLFEEETSTPLGLVQNGMTILRSPLPAINTFNNTLYIFTGIGDYGTELKSGPNKGMDKYVRNVLKYSLPFWRDYDRIVNFPESDVMFGIFDNDNLK